jgi:hypothetical protein
MQCNPFPLPNRSHACSQLAFGDGPPAAAQKTVFGAAPDQDGILQHDSAAVRLVSMVSVHLQP